jgi:hypothetical protein
MARIDPEARAAAEKSARKRLEDAARTPVAKPKTAKDDPAALEKVLRTAIENNEAQLARFDADQNGKLDDQEWNAARQEIRRWAGVDGAVRTPAEEQKRLEAVAAEVERRRVMREKAKKEK